MSGWDEITRVLGNAHIATDLPDPLQRAANFPMLPTRLNHTCAMVSPSDRAEAQINRITDYFSGPSGRTNYNRLLYIAESVSARFKMISGWATRSGADFLNEAVSTCLSVGEDGECVRVVPLNVPVDATLIMIVRSLVNRAYISKDRRSAGELPTAAASAGSGDAIDFEPHEMMWDGEGDRMTPEERQDALDRFDDFVDFAKPDRVVHGMLLLIKNEGLDKPADLIARRLGVTEIEIYQARKRLASAVGRYMNQMEAA